MQSKLEKYIQRDVVDTITPQKARFPEVKFPSLILSDKDFSNINFDLHILAISEPFEMIKTPHKHDDDQFLLFIGGDLTNMPELGGEVEVTLSEDGINLEKFNLNTSSWVYVPKGLYHCPLKFTKVNDPQKPILFLDFYFAAEYGGKIQVDS